MLLEFELACALALALFAKHGLKLRLFCFLKGVNMAVRRIVVEVVLRVGDIGEGSLTVHLGIGRKLAKVLDRVKLSEGATELNGDFGVDQIGRFTEQVILGSLADGFGATQIT